ncbi:hypothetical protein Slin15195_G117840 [Septoria linicola]|uniref:Uncharacterized protein n=1 Tax=Septoria linicola TaxID=215465 RepID=A0A9Q9B578_9PEZI|nr:hypothetical protein Slin15195_G117840 [Septoria linicola]
MKFFLVTLLLAICALAMALPTPVPANNNEAATLSERGLAGIFKHVTKALSKLKGGKKGPKQIIPDIKEHFKITNNGRGTTVIGRWGTVKNS